MTPFQSAYFIWIIERDASMNKIFLLCLLCLSSQLFAAKNSNDQVLTDSLENPGSIEKPAWFKNSFVIVQ